MKNNVYSVIGFLTEIGEPQSFDNFNVREFKVRTKEDYPQDLKFDLFNDKMSILDGFSDGQEVEVYFSIKGRVYKDRTYHTLRAFSVKKASGNKAPSRAVAAREEVPAIPSDDTVAAGSTEEPVF